LAASDASETLEAALDEVVAHTLDEGVSADELSRAKTRMQAESVYARDSLSGAARIFGSALTTGLTVEDIERWPERMAAVTLEQVNAAARDVVRIEGSVTGVLRPPERGDRGETG